MRTLGPRRLTAHTATRAALALILLGAVPVAIPAALSAQSRGVPFSAVADSARLAPVADLRIAYGSAASQFAELRVPSGPGPHPVVMLLHGGCWLSAYGVDHVAGIAESLRQRGIAVFAVEYRRVGEEGAGVPGTFDDVRSAFDSLRALAPRHALDLSRAVLLGHSAGGHLALWLASEPEVRVRAVVGLAAVTDLASFATPTGCGSAVPRLMNGAAESDSAGYAARSPLWRAAPAAGTKLLLVSADSDHIVPLSQADSFIARFPGTEKLSVPGGHFDVVAPWTPAWSRVLERIVALLREP